MTGQSVANGRKYYGGSPVTDYAVMASYLLWQQRFDDPDEIVIESLGGNGRSVRDVVRSVIDHTDQGWRQVDSLLRTAERLQKRPGSTMGWEMALTQILKSQSAFNSLSANARGEISIG